MKLFLIVELVSSYLMEWQAVISWNGRFDVQDFFFDEIHLFIYNAIDSDKVLVILVSGVTSSSINIQCQAL